MYFENFSLLKNISDKQRQKSFFSMLRTKMHPKLTVLTPPDRGYRRDLYFAKFVTNNRIKFTDFWQNVNSFIHFIFLFHASHYYSI